MSTITLGASGGADTHLARARAGAAAASWPAHALSRLEELVRRDCVAVGKKKALIALGGPDTWAYEKSLTCGMRYELMPGGRVQRSITCKKRWCYACRPRVFNERAQKYNRALDGAGRVLGGLWFVTLTAPGVPVWELPAHLKALQRAFTSVNDAMRRQSKTKVGGPRLVGVRKLEVCASSRPGRTTLLVPHFHLIVAGEAAALDLERRWLATMPRAKPDYQFVAPIGPGRSGAEDAGESVADGDGDEVPVYDLFLVTRYLAKGVVPDGDSGTPMPAEQADAVYRAMHGLPLWRDLGGLSGYAEHSVLPEVPAWVGGELPQDWAVFDGADAVSMGTGEVLAQRSAT